MLSRYRLFLEALLPQRIVLALFLASLGFNVLLAISDFNWLIVPAVLTGWYLADMLSGLVHMYMDYRPCPAGKRLNDIFFYDGSRESEEYLSMLQERMASIGFFARLSYDFKNHHPRPDALGRRSLWRLIGSTVIIAALPLSLVGNVVGCFLSAPGWTLAGLTAFLTGGAFAQYFHGSLHRESNPWLIDLLRKCHLLMMPAAHQIHHDTLKHDFATNCGWSNPVVNRLFRMLRARGFLPDSGLVPSP